jgi:hypothetical protein
MTPTPAGGWIDPQALQGLGMIDVRPSELGLVSVFVVSGSPWT